MAYDNELRGALFKNAEKVEGDKSADYTGSAQIQGVDYFMDAWIEVAQTGRKYMSVRFKAKKKQADAPSKPEPKQTRGSADDPPW